jgi:outer membrane protein TolC
MKAWMTGVALALASLAPVGAALQANEGPLTLGRALAQALANSPRLDLARAGIQGARAQVRGAKAAGQPNVDLNVNGRTQAPRRTIDLAKVGDPNTPPVFVTKLLTPNRILETDLRLLQPLYTGGALTARRRAARRGRRAAQARLAAEEQRLVLDVAEAYLAVLEAQRQTELEGALRELDEERLRVARLRLVAGVGILLEASQTEADLAQAVQREIEAGARTRQAAATLNTLVGRPAFAPLVLVDLPEPTTGSPPRLPMTAPPSPERLRDLGLDRPDLQALREEVRRAEAEVNAARAARRPQINLFANYLSRVPATLPGSYAAALGASLLQSVYDGGRLQAQVAATRAERNRRLALAEEGERQVEEQVEQARVALDAAEERVAAEKRRVLAAQEVVAVANRRLGAGTAAPIEVTEAETVLARAQTAALVARFEAARARVQLAFAVGIADPNVVRGLVTAPSP